MLPRFYVIGKELLPKHCQMVSLRVNRSAYRWPEKFAALVTIAGRIESETNPAYFSQSRH